MALIATLGTFVVFTTTTLVNEPTTAIALVVILVVAVVLDLVWKRIRDKRRADGGCCGPVKPRALG